MKKVLSLLTVIVMLISFCACGAANAPTTQQSLETNLPTTAASVATTQPPVTAIPAETTIPTEPTVPTQTTIPTEPPQETVPVLPQGTIHISAPEDIYADNPEEAGDVELHIEGGSRFIWNVAHSNWNRYEAFGNYYALGVILKISDPSFVDKNIEYFASTNLEGFYTSLNSEDGYVGSQATFAQSIMWKPQEVDIDNGPEQVWIDVVVRANGQIVGMAVFAVEGYGSYYSSKLFYMYSEGYPMIDGKFQNVSEEFVRSRIEAYHQYGLNADLNEKWLEQEAFMEAYVEEHWQVYYDERKPLAGDHVIHITSSSTVINDDTDNVKMLIVQDYDLVRKDFAEQNRYLLGSDLYMGIWISIALQDQELNQGKINLEFRTNYGGLFALLNDEYVGTTATSKQSILWHGIFEIPDIDALKLDKPDMIFVDVVVMDGEFIVGMIVYQIVPWEGHYEGYWAQYCYSESYKLVDGHFQDITEEFVNSRIDACHQYFMNNAE